MVRPGVVALVLVALAVPAGAARDLPRQLGMYSQQGASLAMLDSDVAVRVRGPIVEATITQTFRNDTDRVTEATYIFPLPMDAAVSAMELEIGNRTIRAAIESRAAAQQRYETAIAAGVGAGLFEQERPDVFTQTVSAIPARGTVKVTLRLDTVARYQAGTWELVLPLVVAPRYVPGTASGRPTTGTGRAPDTDRAPDASRVTPAGAPGAGGRTDFTLELDDPVTDVTSPTHELKASTTGYTFADPKSDHDAVIRWRSKTATRAWVEAADDGGFAAVLVEAKPAAARKTPVKIVLVVDDAATVRGDAQAVQRPLVRSLLGALAPRDTVALGGNKLLFGTARAAQQALDETAPISVAFDLTKLLPKLRGDHAIVLVSDGLVADDRAALAAAAKLKTVIHVIGVGPAPNRSLLAQLAHTTGGTIRFAVIGDDLAALARDVLADAAAPPERIAITWGTLAVSDTVPATLPRLGAGQALLVVGRVKKLHAANARVRGDVLGFIQVTTPKPPDGATSLRGSLGRRWAKLKLDELIAAGQIKAVSEHALRYGLVSPATSMVAIGDEVIVKGGVKHTVSVPVSVPAGMQWQLVKQQTTVDTTVTSQTKSRTEHDRVADNKRHPAKTKPKDARPVTKKPGKGGQGAPAREQRQPIAVKDKPRRPVIVAPRDQRVPIAAGPSHEPPPPGATVTGSTSGAPAPSPEKPSVDTSPRGGEADDHDRASGDAEDEVSMGQSAPEPTTMAAANDPYEDDELDESEISTQSLRRRLRLSLALGGGLIVTGGDSGALGAFGARAEFGRRTLVGVEGAFWLVTGQPDQASVLATLSRRVSRKIELGGGLGVRFGADAVGPALDLTVRALLPVRGLATYLRYDGALLRSEGLSTGQNAGSFGLEARW